MRTAISAFMASMIFALPARGHEGTEKIFLEVGQRKFLALPTHEKIFVPKNDVLAVRDLGKKIEMRALKTGSVDFRIHETIYEVFVVASSSDKAIDGELSKMEGLSFLHRNGLLQVHGELWRFADWLRLSQLLAATTYTFRAQMDSEVERQAVDYFYTELRHRNLPLPSSPLRFPQSVHFGHIDKPQADTLREFFARFGLDTVVDEQGLSLVPLVRLRVLVAEINQEFSRQLGIHWQGSYEAQLLPTINDPNGLFVQLQSLESSGHGQILASPNLVCRSGGEAEFMAGGEFPIRLQSFQQNHVTWKRHGVMLKFQPQADAVGHITMTVGVEVSMVDPHQIVDGVPGLKTHRIQSQLNMLSHKTLVLSGLLRNNFGRNDEGLVFLKDIPILGLLFHSKNFLENRTELAVFVTPNIEKLEGPSDPLELPHGWRPFEYLEDEG